MAGPERVSSRGINEGDAAKYGLWMVVRVSGKTPRGGPKFSSATARSVEVTTRQRHIAIIGAGFAGVCMGIRLREAGLDNFTIFEKATEPGGTWRDNTYPGVACDVPSDLYSYSFAQQPDWSRAYSPGAEIQQYLLGCIENYGLREHLRLGCHIRRCEYGERSWRLHTASGEVLEADVVISATGGLHIPRFPDIPGVETFAGATFHSARWRHDVALAERRVAIIGSAASAVQIVPEIAADVGRLYVFQRTANWIIPQGDQPVSAFSKWCKRRVPGWLRLRRWLLFWMAESRFPAFRVHSPANLLGRLWPLWHLRRQVRDPALRRQLTPDYPLGCKRILRSDHYYPALQRDNVELVTDPIVAIDANGITTQSGHVPVEVIIYATGFQVFDVSGGVEVTGRNGASLAEVWSGGIRAHRSMTVPGFPNFFILMGPNSALGHNSVVFMMEAQARYIVRCLSLMDRLGWQAIEPGKQAFSDSQARLDADLERTVWRHGCDSWYRDPAGHVFTLWPHTATAYWASLRRLRVDEYVGG